jgi:FkbM family methyltransferase
MSLTSRIARKIRRMAWQPDIRITPAANLVHLGTEYGGWYFLDTGDLAGSMVISGGLGEDASFDVLFTAKYGARVIMIDPTPRAVAHFRGIQERMGRAAEAAFVPGGAQPVTAYDLRGIKQGDLALVEKALWTRDEPVRFYQPANPEHVSHSIANLYNSAEGSYLEVPSTTLPGIVREFDLSRIAILKIDIEGVEVDVLTDMLAHGIQPDQILTEFDEIVSPSPAVKRKYEACDRMLRDAGYVCVACKGDVNFSYAKAQLVKRA